jgi:hypothetical protein
MVLIVDVRSGSGRVAVGCSGGHRTLIAERARRRPEPELDLEIDHEPTPTQPKVKQYASTPDSRNSISNRRSAMTPD